MLLTVSVFHNMIKSLGTLPKKERGIRCIQNFYKRFIATQIWLRKPPLWLNKKSVIISRSKARQANCIGTKKIFSWLLMGSNFLKSSNQLCVHLRNFIKSIWQIHLVLYISCHFSHIHLMMVSPLWIIRQSTTVWAHGKI